MFPYIDTYRATPPASITKKRKTMSLKFELVISANNEIIHAVTKDVNSKHFAQSLEEFQMAANETLTKMIEDLGHLDSNDFNMDADAGSSENEEDINVVTPKKIKSCV